MKELSVEEKAKCYDSMFERLKEMYNNNKTNVAARLIAECCGWLAMNTNLGHDEIEGCRSLMLTVKEEQCKKQKEE